MATLESIEAQLTAMQSGIISRFDDIDSTLTTMQSGIIGKFNNLVQHRTCTVCHGTGEINTPVEGEPGPPYSCPNCGGDGTVKSGKIDTISDDPAAG